MDYSAKKGHNGKTRISLFDPKVTNKVQEPKKTEKNITQINIISCENDSKNNKSQNENASVQSKRSIFSDQKESENNKKINISNFSNISKSKKSENLDNISETNSKVLSDVANKDSISQSRKSGQSNSSQYLSLKNSQDAFSQKPRRSCGSQKKQKTAKKNKHSRIKSVSLYVNSIPTNFKNQLHQKPETQKAYDVNPPIPEKPNEVPELISNKGLSHQAVKSRSIFINLDDYKSVSRKSLSSKKSNQNSSKSFMGVSNKKVGVYSIMGEDVSCISQKHEVHRQILRSGKRVGDACKEGSNRKCLSVRSIKTKNRENDKEM